MLNRPAWVTWLLPDLEVDRVALSEEKERDVHGKGPVGGLQR